MSTIEQMKTSVERIRKNRPSYQAILGFYSQVFEAQEESKQEILLPSVTIEPDILEIKKESNMPLIDPSQFWVDTASAAKLLMRICDVAQDAAPKLSQDARNIIKAIENDQLNSKNVFTAILENRESDLDELSKKVSVPVSKLKLFGFLAMAPSITAGAQQLETYLDKDIQHDHGYCPICGNQADLAILDEDGQRRLKCCFCSHQWAAKRMGCVFCRNTDPDKQQYFYSNNEKEYRVNLCNECSNYIKVVDLRQMNRYFYPGLELISTLHLDLKAKEKGYVNSVDL